MADPLTTGEDAAPRAAGRSTDLTGEDERRTARQTLVDAVLQDVAGLMPQQLLPSATYRVQFQRAFNFRQAAELVPYLSQLGITHVYASPYLRARSGSTHGYDIVDHTRLNPELGSDIDFTAFIAALRQHGMGHVLDFVPNHMGVGSDENVWWQDVLENGPSSPFASFFDVDWQPLKADLRNKVLLPVLGDQFGTVLEAQQLVLQFSEGTFVLNHGGRLYPIAPRSYVRILKHRLEELQRRLGDDHPQFLEYRSIITAIGHLPPRDVTDPERLQERQREKEVIKRRLQRLGDESPLVLQFVRENVAEFNGRAGDSHSFDLLDSLLGEQAYRLSYWRVAADEVNYRRFFDVNELAAVCMENPVVFEKTHARVMQLLQDGQLDGLRIDHADGLYDPAGYLWQLQKCRFLQLGRQAWQLRLQAAALPDLPSEEEMLAALGEAFEARRRDAPPPPGARPLYIIVEKILEGQEPLPADWPVHGTTGYEFLNMVNGLFVRPENARPLDAIYRRFTGERRDFDELVYQSKRLAMRVSMAGELNVLGHQLDRISEHDRRSRDFTENGLTHALREIVACFPVYRTYTTSAGVLERDQKYIQQAVLRAKLRNPAVSHAVFDFVRDVLSMKFCSGASPELRAMVLGFVARFQQFTGPVMAKSVEDTAYYNFHRLVSLNEVGGDPRRMGVSVDELHSFHRARLASQPWALSATATHDTKRGEDTRARINVLSEIPHRWKEHALRWARWNKRKKRKINGEPAPSRSVEYLLYQILVGTWPFDSPHGDTLAEYLARLRQYLTKALREAKVHSSWIAPNEAYEQATHDFLEAILADEPLSAFRTDFEPFARQVAWGGIWNSLSQTLLKLTSPGVPDVYQGTELWDLSLVDPDNRRPVDYAQRQQILAELSAASPSGRAELARQLVATAPDGRIKLFLLAEVLRWRRAHAALFATGEYLPVEVRGERREHVFSFARRSDAAAVVVVVPRWTASLTGAPGHPPVGMELWGETCLHLPRELAGCCWRELLSGHPLDSAPSLRVGDVLQTLPIAVLCTGPDPTHANEPVSDPTPRAGGP